MGVINIFISYWIKVMERWFIEKSDKYTDKINALDYTCLSRNNSLALNKNLIIDSI